MHVPLHQRITTAPLVHDRDRARSALDDLGARCDQQAELAPLRSLLERISVRELLAGIFGCSPYLTGLAERQPIGLLRALAADPESYFADLCHQVTSAAVSSNSMPEAMRALRTFKNEVALLTALCDLGGIWPVMIVARHLSQAADAAVAAGVRFLFRQAHARGEWLSDGPDGFIVLGMGKYGAFELNYSSDIDLIVLYDLERIRLRPDLEVQHFFVRLTRDLVRLLHERTADGYVFRTDLRLRPDPGATPLALSTDAALNYYESFGQNWERAALIKARPVAGDLAAAEAILEDLAPFIWRKYLDFAAIADIHAMKRQIHAFRGFGSIAVAGHNIKLGRGGIREIEFFVQTQQLIAGGRQHDLRTPETLVGLARLEQRGWIKAEVRKVLDEAYRFLRTIENRLQMISDEQTQDLPEDPEKLSQIAHFSGFVDTSAFSSRLIAELEKVQAHYVRLFEHSPELTRKGTNMVFAGAADDPATLEALSGMGYARPAAVIAGVRAWHHGRYPAVRTARARELLTEVQPGLIEALANTADPDLAFLGFDRFLSALPSGIQLFSLLKQNPNLLDLIAAIAGTAPRLSRILSKRGSVLDAVLTPGFFGTLPSREDLYGIVDAELKSAEDFQEALDRARQVANEQAFLIGVRVLTGTISAGRAGNAYALLAECMIEAMQTAVERAMATVHGHVPRGAAVVVALGKLGGCEMTAASDLDLILIYDFDPTATQSDGARPLPPMHYYSRLTQRLIGAISSQTAEGKLYDVDMRLRPSGQKGPVATQLSSFIDYQSREAWTWEHLALTRARVVSGPLHLRSLVERAITKVLLNRRDRAAIAADVCSMRARIEKEKGTSNIWDLKQVRGGLVDLEFIVQYLQLVSAADHPQVPSQNTVSALVNLRDAGVLPTHASEELLPAAQLFNDLTQVLRLCLDGPFEPAKAPDGLKALLAKAVDAPDFGHLEADLAARQAQVAALFAQLVR